MLPFRIPVDTGSETFYLLIPLYLVIAGGVVAEAVTVVRGDGRQIPPPAGAARWLAIALSASIVLYALQTIYSTDVTRATQNIAFFIRNRLSAVPIIASPLQNAGGWNSLFTPIVSKPGRTGLRPGWPQRRFRTRPPGETGYCFPC